jgi:hypothetical protein
MSFHSLFLCRLPCCRRRDDQKIPEFPKFKIPVNPVIYGAYWQYFEIPKIASSLQIHAKIEDDSAYRRLYIIFLDIIYSRIIS